MTRQEFFALAIASSLAVLFGKHKQREDLGGYVIANAYGLGAPRVTYKYHYFKMNGTRIQLIKEGKNNGN